MYPIENNVPFPKRVYRNKKYNKIREFIATLAALEPGQSFLLERELSSNMRCVVSTLETVLGARFVSERVETWTHEDQYRIWRRE